MVGVNFLGFINTQQAFLPHMLAHGEGGHVVNTASIAGLITEPRVMPYAATKYGVVAISEAVAQSLSKKNIGVSVLCPGTVDTGMATSSRNRPDHLGGPQEDANRTLEEFMEIERVRDAGKGWPQLNTRVVQPEEVGEMSSPLSRSESSIFPPPRHGRLRRKPLQLHRRGLPTVERAPRDRHTPRSWGVGDTRPALRR